MFEKTVLDHHEVNVFHTVQLKCGVLWVTGVTWGTSQHEIRDVSAGNHEDKAFRFMHKQDALNAAEVAGGGHVFLNTTTSTKITTRHML